MAKVLIVEDDAALLESLAVWLKHDKHNVDSVGDGNLALDYLKAADYDLLILDWELPGCSGIEVCRRYRESGGQAYIIMLTGQTSSEQMVRGLDNGADDYVTKPFNAKVLSARIRALFRRPPQTRSNVLQLDTLLLDQKTHEASVGGTALKLMPLEFSLLEFFMRHPNHVFSGEALLRQVWSSDADVSLDSVYACVNRLRRKLEKQGAKQSIENVYGVGYKFVDAN